MTVETQNNNELDQMRLIVDAVIGATDSAHAGRSSSRTEILIHSIGVFSRQGLESTTVQHLLDEARVSRRTFYKYFKNKYDVLESLYKIFIENMVLLFRTEAERAITVRDIISGTFKTYFDYHLSLGTMIRLMAEEARRTESVLSPHRDVAFSSTAHILQAEMQRVSGKKHDILVFNTLIWTLESYSLNLLNHTDCSVETVDHYKHVMVGIAEAILIEGASSALLSA
ncbi:MAG: TetR/AcrR family transcriptional regulator [Gammaproteobacteria bacterium]|jgi:AcrR family transcriptional regulator|nr:TetR/AcrR family transcriptional regulator [Gammaproteobacteria bacterium]MBQ0775278.1 TetR/AcrR family transcriptional regulator [Gammaproteobacteria bacterium]|tara:strand:- start:154615 stop:155295 length:681 start_codon:yes stop_codon:yes gene_type:complete